MASGEDGDLAKLAPVVDQLKTRVTSCVDALKALNLSLDELSFALVFPAEREAGTAVQKRGTATPVSKARQPAEMRQPPTPKPRGAKAQLPPTPKHGEQLPTTPRPLGQDLPATPVGQPATSAGASLPATPVVPQRLPSTPGRGKKREPRLPEPAKLSASSTAPKKPRNGKERQSSAERPDTPAKQAVTPVATSSAAPASPADTDQLIDFLAELDTSSARSEVGKGKEMVDANKGQSAASLRQEKPSVKASTELVPAKQVASSGREEEEDVDADLLADLEDDLLAGLDETSETVPKDPLASSGSLVSPGSLPASLGPAPTVNGGPGESGSSLVKHPRQDEDDSTACPSSWLTDRTAAEEEEEKLVLIKPVHSNSLDRPLRQAPRVPQFLSLEEERWLWYLKNSEEQRTTSASSSANGSSTQIPSPDVQARPIQPSSDSLSAPEGAQPMETDGMEEQVEPPKAHAPPAESASSLGPREGQSQPAPAPKALAPEFEPQESAPQQQAPAPKAVQARQEAEESDVEEEPQQEHTKDVGSKPKKPKKSASKKSSEWKARMFGSAGSTVTVQQRGKGRGKGGRGRARPGAEEEQSMAHDPFSVADDGFLDDLLADVDDVIPSWTPGR